MDALTFASKLVEALAWPLSLAVVAWLLKAELRELLRLVRRLKAGPVEAEFDREVYSLRAEAESSKRSLEPDRAVGAQPEPLLELAARHPRSAILEAWRSVEFAMLRLANARDLLPPGLDKVPSRHVIGVIMKKDLLTREDFALYYDLRNLRNQAAHAVVEPSEAAAIDYVKLAQWFVNAVNETTRRLKS